MKGIPRRAGEGEASGERLGPAGCGMAEARQGRVLITIPITPSGEGISQLVIAGLRQGLQSRPPVRGPGSLENSPELVFREAVMVNQYCWATI